MEGEDDEKQMRRTRIPIHKRRFQCKRRPRSSRMPNPQSQHCTAAPAMRRPLQSNRTQSTLQMPREQNGHGGHMRRRIDSARMRGRGGCVRKESASAERIRIVSTNCGTNPITDNTVGTFSTQLIQVNPNQDGSNTQMEEGRSRRHELGRCVPSRTGTH